MEDRLFYSAIALLSACSWALGAILWKKLGEHLSAYSMNLAKTVLGSFFLAMSLMFTGWASMDNSSLVFLMLSGIIGIAVGDTFFFLSLLHLGPRRASLMGSLNPVAIALAAAILLGEKPSITVWIGIIATTVGVGWVLRERTSGTNGEEARYPLGVIYGILSVLCTAGAVLLAKVGVSSVPTVQATWIRLLAGAVGLVVWGILHSELGAGMAPFRRGGLLIKVVAVVLVVVVGGFWLSLVALKHVDASIVGPLNSTGPIFILPMAVLLLNEKLSLRAIAGAIVAVAGVALILTG
ncbi:MAG: DMT family transporter [Desulfobulbaceae bacterium]|nr:DMT family transporter [Desulfobulbaceae bacterium]